MTGLSENVKTDTLIQSNNTAANIGDDDYNFFVKFLKNTSGYNLTADKKYLLASQISNVMKCHSFRSIQTLIEKLKSGPQGEISTDVIEGMTVNETFFFRDGSPYVVFEEIILPELIKNAKGNKIRIWSAACSTGQEPYSIAMLLEDRMHSYGGFNYEIIATDINNRILAEARRGLYSSIQVNRGLPEIYKNKFFKQDGHMWSVTDRIRQHVTFRQMNLKNSTYQFDQKFDFVLLRNVLIYFDKEHKEQIIRNVAKVMAPGGFLMLGAPEALDLKDPNFKKHHALNCLYRASPLP